MAPFLAFLERFLPDRREREWLLDWMAHKMRRPEIPGTAIVFVADDVEDTGNGKFGTGRGMLFAHGDPAIRPQLHPRAKLQRRQRHLIARHLHRLDPGQRPGDGR